jgi:hypothetical protein
MRCSQVDMPNYVVHVSSRARNQAEVYADQMDVVEDRYDDP